MQISGSSAIVVGGAGGLGEATVRRMVAVGAKVVVADLADEKGKALEQELDVRYVRTDATDSIDRAFIPDGAVFAEASHVAGASSTRTARVSTHS
jgi:NAD(P)-dependent dehydrogenase (short-subunit alcohol dehydrogenase family)